MSIEQTLAIIKPEAVARDIIGALCGMIERESLHIVATKMLQLDVERAAEFYATHKDRAFFPFLVEYMSSGPVCVLVLEGEDAIARYRNLMGATRPGDAVEGTIRHHYAVHDPDSRVFRNAVHGSDCSTAATREIAFFFSAEKICTRINSGGKCT